MLIPRDAVLFQPGGFDRIGVYILVLPDVSAESYWKTHFIMGNKK